MYSLPDLTELRRSLQRQHTEHVLIELNLARTFLEMGELERQSGELESANQSFFHAQRALFGARKGLPNIDDLATRQQFEEQIKNLEQEVARKEPK